MSAGVASVTPSIEGYAVAAAGRPGLALWGKAKPLPTFSTIAHPLICHMIDVAVVCEHLVDHVLSPGTRRRFLSSWGCDAASARAWVLLLVALHDFGKATPAFQAKSGEVKEVLQRLGFDVDAVDGRDHGTVGPYFLAPVLEQWGISEGSAYRLARSVCAHHGTFPPDDEVPADAHDPKLAISRRERGSQPIWSTARGELLAALEQVFPRPTEVPQVREDGRQTWAFYSMLAGLAAVSDWIGSMAHHFVYEEPPEDVRAYAERARARAATALREVGLRGVDVAPAGSFFELFGRSPRPLQELAERVGNVAEEPMLFLAEAPMGEGKTETAFYLARALEARGIHTGMYVALPTQATANQMFSRLVEYLHRTSTGRTSAILVHGEASLNTRMQRLIRDVHGGSGDDGVACERWFLGKKRALLASYGAGTIDQALLSVLRTKHAFVRQFGLAGKTVVLDEVHAYDAYTSQLLERLVAWLGAHGTSVVLLSATLPAARRKHLVAAYLGKKAVALDATAYPRVSVAHGERVEVLPIGTGRPQQTFSLSWLPDEAPDECDALIAELARSIEQGGCAAILRNTVDRAQRTFLALRRAKDSGRLPPTTELLLVHARFPAEDRARLEERLVNALGPESERPTHMIVIGTQVLEQSLDVDFDLMFTDLAPVDLLLQRAGRVHRHGGRMRPHAVQHPRLVVVRPRGDAASCSFETVAQGVYDNYVLRKTLLELEGRDVVQLPRDIELLVEAVYSDVPPVDGKLLDDWRELAERRQEEELLARKRAWPPPTIPDDPFADLRVPFREDDPEVARALRAATRLGDDSVVVVCLFGSEQRAYLDYERTHLVDLDKDFSPAEVRALAGRSVRLGRRDVVRALQTQEAPRTFCDVAVLARWRALIFDGAPKLLGSTFVDLDPSLGITFRKQDNTLVGDDQDAF